MLLQTLFHWLYLLLGVFHQLNLHSFFVIEKVKALYHPPATLKALWVILSSDAK